jgi:hypothetical protein
MIQSAAAAGICVALFSRGGYMTARTYGLLAGALAFGAWWWNRNRTASASLPASRERGTVIFDNTPSATGIMDEGVV